MKINKYLLFLFFLFTLFGYSQINTFPIKSKEHMAAEVYGYTSGIEISLDLISDKFPHMIYDINRIRLLYKSNFGKTKSNALGFLKNTWRSTEFDAFIEGMDEKIFQLQYLTSLLITDQEARDYINSTEINLKGSLESPTLEYLLLFQYQDNPHDEFRAGYTYTFNTLGHRKSKNTDFQLKLPKSWYAKEGNGPNIVQIFSSENGKGTEIITLLIRDFSEMGYDFETIRNEYGSEADEVLREIMFSEEVIQEMIPVNGKLISSKSMSITMNECIQVIVEYPGETMGIKMKTRGIWYLFIKDFKIFLLQASVSTHNLEEDLSIKMNKFYPLYMLIANSIRINDVSNDIIQLNGPSNRKFISVEINSKNIDFLLDTGASSSLISKKLINNLLASGAITQDNYMGKSQGRIADGSIVMSELWLLPQIKIGNRIINNVVFSVFDSDDIVPLLGMDILEALDILKIDLSSNKIYLHNRD